MMMAWEEETRRHAEMFSGFMKFTTYSTIAVVLTLILMALFLL